MVAVSAALRRVTWSLADQVVASLTNFALTILVARSVPAAEFGVFALLFGFYIFAVYVLRGVGADPLMTRFTAIDDVQWRAGCSSSAAAVLLVAGAFAVITLIAGFLLPGQVAGPVVALAVVLPGALLQDHLRFVFFTHGTPREAFTNDALWAVAQLAGVVGLTALDLHSVALLILVWGAAGNTAAVVGLARARLRPDFRAARVWLRSQRDLWRYYVIENATLQGTNLVVLGIVGAVAGLAASGGIRAAVTVFAPLSVLGLGVVAGATAEFARSARERPRRMRRRATAVGVSLGAIAAMWGIGAWALPTSVGEALFGASWGPAVPLLLLVTADTVAAMFLLGPFAGLRSLGNGRASLQVRVAFSIARLGVATTGAILDGAHGAVVGFALVAPVQMVVWWWQLRRASAAGVSDRQRT